jgi:hypothetical protein
MGNVTFQIVTKGFPAILTVCGGLCVYLGLHYGKDIVWGIGILIMGVAAILWYLEWAAEEDYRNRHPFYDGKGQ